MTTALSPASTRSIMITCNNAAIDSGDRMKRSFIDSGPFDVQSVRHRNRGAARGARPDGAKMAVRPRSDKVEGAAANWPSRNRLPMPIGFDTPAGTPRLKPASKPLPQCTANVASLIGRLGSSTFRLSTTAVLMSLTGSRFSSESAPGPLYGAFLVKKFKQGSPSFFFVSFFVRFESLFLRPDRGFAHAGARRSCQGWPLYQPCGILQPC